MIYRLTAMNMSGPGYTIPDVADRQLYFERSSLYKRPTNCFTLGDREADLIFFWKGVWFTQSHWTCSLCICGEHVGSKVIIKDFCISFVVSHATWWFLWGLSSGYHLLLQVFRQYRCRVRLGWGCGWWHSWNIAWWGAMASLGDQQVTRCWCELDSQVV